MTSKLPFRTLISILLFSGIWPGVKAQTTTWSSILFTITGDHTPLLLTSSPSLTTLGAIQLHNAGSSIRNRYLTPTNSSGTTIPGLPVSYIDNSLINILATEDEYVVASAQAFLQGLYPPVGAAGGNEGLEGVLANGSVVEGPLGGYQFGGIKTVGDGEVGYIWLAGSEDCPQYAISSAQYLKSEDYNNTLASSAAFYSDIYQQLFSSVIVEEESNYRNAYELWEYAQFAYTHNSTIFNSLPIATLTQLRSYASQFVSATNGDRSVQGLTPNDQILTISGQTLATTILTTLQDTILSPTHHPTLTLLFGPPTPFISFSSLTTLGLSTSTSTSFTGLPQWGSTISLELFSNNADLTTPDEFPNSTENLWVRFLFRNGTSDNEELREYPLFGRGNSETDMLWGDFLEGMQGIGVGGVEDWCGKCGNLDTFCVAFSDDNSDSSDAELKSTNIHHSSVSPVIAGLIGVIITTAFIALLALLAALLGGIRIRKSDSQSQKRLIGPRASLGGFKGAEKLDGDRDVERTVEGVARERLGSWELKGKKDEGLVVGEGGERDLGDGDWDQGEGDEGIMDGVKPTVVEDRV